MFQESIAAEFLDKLVKWTKNIKIADPLEEGCRLGPVVSGGQVRKLVLINYYLFLHVTKQSIVTSQRSSLIFCGQSSYKTIVQVFRQALE